MNFAEAEQRYRPLKQQYDAGSLSAGEFDEALKELMVQDERGRWWALSREGGNWNFYDDASGDWVTADPPRGQARPTAPPPPGQSLIRESPLTHMQPPGQTTYTPPAYSPNPGMSTVSPGLKMVFYILSFLVPILGIVLFFVYRTAPVEEDRKMAQVLLILGLASFGLGCLCSILAVAAGGGGGF